MRLMCYATWSHWGSMVNKNLTLSIPRAGQVENMHSVLRCWLHVRGLYIAMVQYSSLCEGAAVISLGAVDIGDEVLGRVQIE